MLRFPRMRILPVGLLRLVLLRLVLVLWWWPVGRPDGRVVMPPVLDIFLLALERLLLPQLLLQLLTLNVGAMLLIACVAALALASGIGGGGIYVPLLNLLLRFRPHVAVGLSQTLICGGALGALVVNLRERHPADHGRPLIDVGLAAFLAPAEMAGAQLGVLLNRALPPFLMALT